MMAVNSNRTDRWKADIAQSVDMYNDWFLQFAPNAYRTTRVQTTNDVEATLKATGNLTDIGVALLRAEPGVLPTLRMATCPPLAVDRLIGLAGVPPRTIRIDETAFTLSSGSPFKFTGVHSGSNLSGIDLNISAITTVAVRTLTTHAVYTQAE
jgi:hypothetical protein